MKIRQKEIEMLSLLDRIINDNDSSLKDKEVGLEIFKIWDKHLNETYNIDHKTQFINRNGEIVTGILL
jgi:hypothetical protein